MITLFIIIGICIWLVIGYKSFVYWWTHDFNYTPTEIPVACAAGILGPFAFIIGFIFHGTQSSKILKEKRKS